MTDITNKLNLLMEIQSDIFFNFSLFLKELESGNSLENTGGLER